MLTAELRENHQHLEKNLLQKLRAMRNLQDYLNLPAIFYSYLGAIEQLVKNDLTKDSLPHYTMRRKAVERLLEQIYAAQSLKNYLKTHGAPGP